MIDTYSIDFDRGILLISIYMRKDNNKKADEKIFTKIYNKRGDDV